MHEASILFGKRSGNPVRVQRKCLSCATALRTSGEKGISTLFQNLQTDDLLLISLIILLLGEGGEDNYIIVIILAVLLFN